MLIRLIATPTGYDRYDWREDLLDREAKHKELEDEDIPDENIENCFDDE